MDKVLEKFGIYDFMGIWGPGAITVTYFYFTMKNSFAKLFNFLNITLPNVSEGYVLLIFYIIVAYVVGVILHESSKLIAESLSGFNIQEIKKLAYNGDEIHGRVGYRIKKEYKEAIESSIHNENQYQQMKFDEAISYLKYVNKMGTARVDKYHSVYALARSLSLCFMSHIIIYLSSAMIENNISNATCVVIIFDLIVFLIFWERTYRYLCAWIKNIFIQYYITKASVGNEQ